jgi:hypothetical protein
MLNENEKEMYERWGVTPPSHEPHGTDKEIRKNLSKLEPTDWRLEGNKLIYKTEMGEVAQFIPTNYILEGTDSKGLPKFKKVV